MEFIEAVFRSENAQFDSFVDLFAGTGVVAHNFNKLNNKIITNDILYSNYLAHYTWLSDEEFNHERVQSLIHQFNERRFLKANYFSNNFSDTYFNHETCLKIGGIRDEIDWLYKKGNINFKEQAILITSLLYAADKIAKTCGHYDAYRKGADENKSLILKMPLIEQSSNKRNEIFNLDANILAKNLKVDMVYIDPPYNSRQYIDTYHLLENLALWDKPELEGVARKMINRQDKKSNYCTTKAPAAFLDLVMNLDTQYLAVSYNNMSEKGNSRSQAKLSDEQIGSILRKKGDVKIFECDHKYFSAGKSIIDDHKERLFLCKINKVNSKLSNGFKAKVESKIVKSPLNYTGNKAELMPQLACLFPKKINTFYDVFTGGAVVSANINAQSIISADNLEILIKFYTFLKNIETNHFLEEIEHTIERYNLSNTSQYSYEKYQANTSDGLAQYNQRQYQLLRSDFNNINDKNKNSLEYFACFYTLIIFSFNNQIRFNRSGLWNVPVGKRDFNNNLKNKLLNFMSSIKNKNIIFKTSDFRTLLQNEFKTDDFVYCDPPYLISQATYNENGSWDIGDEADLLRMLDSLHARGIKFALSNVLLHKGNKNQLLEDWAIDNKYFINKLVKSYKNSNYQLKTKNLESQEVLITNYNPI